jgi:hypothetical protein
MASVIVETAPPRSRARSRFYVGIAILITAIVFAGFAPSMLAIFVRGEPRPWILHLHAAVYVGWLALLIAQAVLAARGNISLHRRVGNFGIAYAVLVWALGVVVSLVVPALHVQAGEWTLERAVTFLPIPLGDMVLFGAFFGAAVAYRHRPEIHKRLVVLATVAVMFAGAGRLMNSVAGTVAVWFLPVLLAMGYDLISRGRVHSVYWIGAAAMALALARVPMAETETWQRIGTALLQPLL